MADTGKTVFEHKRVPLGLAVSAALGATGAHAQSADEKLLEEVIVTATKREMNLQEIPISITAITDEQITLQRFKNFSDYVGQIPSLALSRSKRDLHRPGSTT